MRIGSIANVVGMLGISFFLTVVSSPAFADTVSSGADCNVTGTNQANPVSTLDMTVNQAANFTGAKGSLSEHKDCGLFGMGCWDWGRIGGDALKFGEGLAIGAVTAVAATALVAAAVATFPAWGTAIMVGAAVVGVAALGYGVYSTVKNWNNMSEGDKFFLGGNLVGGIVAGGFSGGISKGVTGLLAGGESSVADGVAASTVAADVARPPVRVQGFLQGNKPTCVPNAFRAIMQFWNGDAAPTVDELSTTAIQRGFAHSGEGGFSTKYTPALAREYGYDVTHIPSGATASDVAAATDQGLPVLTKIVVDQNGNPTTWGSPGALGKHAVVIQEITQDGTVIAKHGWQTADYHWPLADFNASMQSAGGEVVVLHGPSPTLGAH